MSPQPVGLEAYAGTVRPERSAQTSLRKTPPQNLAAALSTEEARALEETFGTPDRPKALPKASLDTTLGRHVDILA